MPINEQLLEERLTQLEDARSWSSRVISKLETLIRTGSDDALFRINPLQYAVEKNMNEDEAIDLFLYATKFGIFEMDWHLVCPYCAHGVESFKELGCLHSHFVCSLCNADAVLSALDMLRDLDAFNRSISEKLILKIGIHRGHSIAVTLNDRLDYFGQSVNIASRIQGIADANEIFISADVYCADGVREALAGCAVTPQEAVMKGVSEMMQVYKVTL